MNFLFSCAKWSPASHAVCQIAGIINHVPLMNLSSGTLYYYRVSFLTLYLSTRHQAETLTWLGIPKHSCLTRVLQFPGIAALDRVVPDLLSQLYLCHL
jgi:hypothetical protein